MHGRALRTPGLLGAVAALATIACLGAARAEPIPRVSDGFEGADVDTSKWSLVQIKPYRHWPEESHVRSGRRSRAIRAKGGDIGRSCDHPCQRSELRLVKRLRAPYAEHVFYGFSFQIRDQVATTGSHRLVIGQWKGEDSGGSPFVAQRFDNRVFHVTVQDNDCRAVVAAAEGDIERALAVQKKERARPLAFVADPRLYACAPEITVTCIEPRCRLPDPYETWADMVYSVRGGRDGSGEVRIWANGKPIAIVTGAIGNDDDGLRQKFKIGIYRADRPEKTTLYLDSFRQGASFEEVDPATFPER